MEDTASDTTMYKKERKIESEGFQMLKIDRNRKRSEKTRNWQGKNERERNRAKEPKGYWQWKKNREREREKGSKRVTDKETNRERK